MMLLVWVKQVTQKQRRTSEQRLIWRLAACQTSVTNFLSTWTNCETVNYNVGILPTILFVLFEWQCHTSISSVCCPLSNITPSCTAERVHTHIHAPLRVRTHRVSSSFVLLWYATRRALNRCHHSTKCNPTHKTVQFPGLEPVTRDDNFLRGLDSPLSYNRGVVSSGPPWRLHPRSTQMIPFTTLSIIQFCVLVGIFDFWHVPAKQPWI